MNEGLDRGPGDADAHGYPGGDAALTQDELAELHAWLDRLNNPDPIF